jgi:hypothetical protein
MHVFVTPFAQKARGVRIFPPQDPVAGSRRIDAAVDALRKLRIAANYRRQFTGADTSYGAEDCGVDAGRAPPFKIRRQASKAPLCT